MHLELPLKIEEPAAPQIPFSKHRKSQKDACMQQAQNLTPLLKKEHVKNCNFAPAAINLICTWMFEKWKIS